MNTTIRLLDTLKRVRGLPSDYAAAKALGRSTACISRWRTGSDQMDVEAIAAVAPMIDEDPAAILASIEAERSKAAERRTLFEKLHDAAELVDLLKRSPALRAQLDRQFREFAETIENPEEKARFLSIARTACILCQIHTPIRHISCSRPKPARKRFPTLTIAQNKELTE